MPTNDFIGFAAAGSANVMSQADYAAAAEQTNGVQPGPASSALANKVWRQGANMAAALGGLVADQGYDALDNGDIATLKNALKSSLLQKKGTWTPTLYGKSTAGAITIISNNSYYRKIDDLVYLRVRFDYRIIDSPTGAVCIGGIPYMPDFYYTDWMVANANTGLAFSINDIGIIRPAYLNTSTGQLVVVNWGATASSSVWANGVNKTDTVLGQLWYRTSE